MNITFLDKEVIQDLERKGTLQKTLADMPNPIFLGSRIMEPVEVMRKVGKAGIGLLFMQPDYDDYE